MTLLRFNGQELTRQLEQLSVPRRIAFAAAVAERLLPAYARFLQLTGRNGFTTVSALLEDVWLHLEGTQSSAEQQHAIERCMNLIPQDDWEPWVAEQDYAASAAMALTYVLRARKNGSAREAAWAAQCAHEALDHFVIGQEGIDINQAGGEERVLEHHLVQAEFSRQQRDMQELGANETVPSVVADRLRARAKAEAASVFVWNEPPVGESQV